MKTFETYRGYVQPWCIDSLGNMSAQSYVARFDEASWQFLAHLGLTPSYLKRQHRSLNTVDQRIQYRLDVNAGALVEIHSQLIEIGDDTVRYLHRMFDSESRIEVATMEVQVAFMDAEVHRIVALPENTRSCVERMMDSMVKNQAR